MLKSIIIEDHAPAQRILKTYISNMKDVCLEKTFCDVSEASEYLQQHQVDLLFLDINLPRISGIDFLKSDVKHPITILTTAHSEFALECYQYNVVDYLLKPFSYERFSQAIQKVMMITGGSSSEDVYVKCSHELVKVKVVDLLFIKSDSDYTEIYTMSGKLLTTSPLREWRIKLSDDFIQIHKSYIINISHLRKLSHNRVFLPKEHVLPVGRAFKKQLLEKFNRVV